MMKERIQKILASRGVASRRAAEKMILDGRVSCNGQTCVLGMTADEDVDIILLDGKELPSKSEHTYIMLNKPRGFVTTMADEKGRKDVSQLVKDCPHRVYPIGRLDMDSEGLLLFTNNGDFANYMMHPSHNVDKVYKVEVTGYSPEALIQVSQPIELDGYMIHKPDVKLIRVNNDRAELYITIHEGRNRQVRRMCAAAGMEVRRLIRVQEGKLKLGNLPWGKWRYLTQEEIQSLRA